MKQDCDTSMTQTPTQAATAESNTPLTTPSVKALISAMSLAEKIGQMSLAQPGEGDPVAVLAPQVRAGTIGAIINVVDPKAVAELQRIAIEESPHGIPLLVGRDVIHGFQTIMPIPLGQAATWNPKRVREGAKCAAEEASLVGVNWTYAPMMDIARDPRWGRIAESFGEDVYLSCELSAAMVQGFQGNDLANPNSVAACAKHFVGYGAAESGRDYATTNISTHELHNVYLPPFKAAVDSGVASVMTSFSDLDGIPATAHGALINGVLRDDWGFEGIVVSDWNSIPELSTHGLSANDHEAAVAAAKAGVDLEMASETYNQHLANAMAAGEVSIEVIDQAVTRLLQLKIDLGLFQNPYPNDQTSQANAQEKAQRAAYDCALESLVLLKNDHATLPLNPTAIERLAVIGPLADEGYEQLGTWIFDGDADLSISVRQGIETQLPKKVVYERALETSRSRDHSGFEAALAAAASADAVVLVIGEEAILSGEAHSRANIDLPGAQVELVKAIRQTGKPVVAVVLAGRPLTLSNMINEVDALVYAWHPGTAGGQAIADVLLGHATPSGKLPVTFPRHVGQVPMYYNAKNSGKPPSPELVTYIDDIPVKAPQTSLGMSAFHLDVEHTPLFPFGYGLSYTHFNYDQLSLSAKRLGPDDTLTVSVEITNSGDRAGEEVVQLYVRDPVASITRPIRELKGFQRVALAAGERRRVAFELSTQALRFYRSTGHGGEWRLEPGVFEVYVGGDSTTTLGARFELSDQ